MELGDGYTKLVYGVNRKDEKAWQELFDSYYESLCHHAARILLDDHVAEDVVQEVFVNLWNGTAVFENEKALTVYLYRSVTNNALKYLRDRNTEEARLRLWSEVERRCPKRIFERGAGRGVAQVEGVDRFITGRTSESDLDEHGWDERGGDCGEVGRDDSYG